MICVFFIKNVVQIVMQKNDDRSYPTSIHTGRTYFYSKVASYVITADSRLNLEHTTYTRGDQKVR